jgi:heat shock protein HslJ
MRNLVGRLLVASALLSMLGACAERASRPNESGSPSTSYQGTWQLLDGRGPEGNVPVINGFRITLDLRDENASGTAACNWYGGNVMIRGGSFAMQGGSMTEMACRPDVMESESSYLAGLRAAEAISRDGDTLKLTGTETELHFELMPPIPTVELIDNRWQLESLIYGSSMDSVASSAGPAHLVLKSDGTLMGSTGCRELHGEWIERGDEIAFTTFGADGECSRELREQDGHVVGVLGDGFTVNIDADQLKVFSRGGLGLVYRDPK